uniref:Uncharacterized protein n=1 Tax=Rhizophora mucronata TaxID=61149 RepID=A0A2P2PW34_RHIMU
MQETTMVLPRFSRAISSRMTENLKAGSPLAASPTTASPLTSSLRLLGSNQPYQLTWTQCITYQILPPVFALPLLEPAFFFF